MWVREGDTLFRHTGVDIEFPNLSDGYRAFIGWVADMLSHAFWVPAARSWPISAVS